MTVVRINAVPAVANPRDGIDYEVLSGNPQDGDPVRISTGGGFVYTYHKEPVARVAKPRALAKTEFMDHCYSQLGGGLTGVSRFGAVIKAARSSTEDTVVAAMERYDHAMSVEKENAAVFIGILKAASIASLTDNECDAVLDTWPSG